jgi:hypothetical protein
MLEREELLCVIWRIKKKKLRRAVKRERLGNLHV